jgi:aconitase B
MKIRIKTLNSLKDGRVLIEVGSEDETNLLRTNISAKYVEVLEVNVQKLRKPRLIVRNIPQDIKVENIEETMLAQNPELNMETGRL